MWPWPKPKSPMRKTSWPPPRPSWRIWNWWRLLQAWFQKCISTPVNGWAPGLPVLLLADLENLQVETTDLGEIDVAQIVVGDTAIVTFDALPELVLEGTVVSIAPKAAPGSGVDYRNSEIERNPCRSALGYDCLCRYRIRISENQVFHLENKTSYQFTRNHSRQATWQRNLP